MDLRIRNLTSDDFASYVALLGELVGPQMVMTGQAGQARFDMMLAETGSVVLGAEVSGAEVSGQIVAVASLHLHHNLTNYGRPYGLIENVVTAQAHRGRGYGRAVIEAAIAQAWAADAYKIMLLTGRKRGAMGFYQALGFSDGDKHGMTLRHV